MTARPADILKQAAELPDKVLFSGDNYLRRVPTLRHSSHAFVLKATLDVAVNEYKNMSDKSNINKLLAGLLISQGYCDNIRALAGEIAVPFNKEYLYYFPYSFLITETPVEDIKNSVGLPLAISSKSMSDDKFKEWIAALSLDKLVALHLNMYVYSTAERYYDVFKEMYKRANISFCSFNTVDKTILDKLPPEVRDYINKPKEDDIFSELADFMEVSEEAFAETIARLTDKLKQDTKKPRKTKNSNPAPVQKPAVGGQPKFLSYADLIAGANEVPVEKVETNDVPAKLKNIAKEVPMEVIETIIVQWKTKYDPMDSQVYAYGLRYVNNITKDEQFKSELDLLPVMGNLDHEDLLLDFTFFLNNLCFHQALYVAAIIVCQSNITNSSARVTATDKFLKKAIKTINDAIASALISAGSANKLLSLITDKNKHLVNLHVLSKPGEK